jgi:hypothetical protein
MEIKLLLNASLTLFVLLVQRTYDMNKIKPFE